MIGHLRTGELSYITSGFSPPVHSKNKESAHMSSIICESESPQKSNFLQTGICFQALEGASAITLLIP